MGRTRKGTSSGDDVKPPKRPMTGYMLFSNDNRAKVKEEHPDIKGVAQVAKILGTMWSKASDSVKKSYQVKYEAAKKKYDKEMEQFKKDHPDFQATRKRKASAGKQEKGGKGAKGKKPKKDPNAPKRPMTPFFMYSQEFREEVRKENPDTKNTDISKILSEQWKELSDAEKKKYQDRFQREKAEYAKKIAAYNKQKKEESESEEEEEEEVVESEEDESDEGSDEESDDDEDSE